VDGVVTTVVGLWWWKSVSHEREWIKL